MTQRRRALLAAAALPVAAPARAQARQVRIVVPFAAGGAVDSAARVILPRNGVRPAAALAAGKRAGGSVGGAEAMRAADIRIE
ncbi:hypothetical protein [Roseomonas sp. CECT 9278]|uniref:hypothetical protein n=1 Tax=Roseomonas sp. CECT 9278 TaxID=2845823 RepID=UPI001E494568|nr:hypothetical protein [Roseomonas sp. CECT 9278]CAH0199151.1 hypothetical protein ROS9278_01877 [Roseomonas sp. CECT 9278]